MSASAGLTGVAFQNEQQRQMKSPLTRGWRQSLRTAGWYRQRGGWCAVVVTHNHGYQIILRRDVPKFEDAFAIANEIINPQEPES